MQVEELKSRLAAGEKKTSAAPDASKAVTGSTPALPENLPKKNETTGSQMKNSIPPTGVVVCFWLHIVYHLKSCFLSCYHSLLYVFFYLCSFGFGSPQALMDILKQDRREAAEQRQEFCDIITKLQSELQNTEEQRDKVRGCLPSYYIIHYNIIMTFSFMILSFLDCTCSWSLSANSYSWRWGLSSWTGRQSRRGVCPISTKSWSWKRRETRLVRAHCLTTKSSSVTLAALAYSHTSPTYSLSALLSSHLKALRSRDSLQLEYTDCLLDKNRLRKRIAELQASLEQQQRELDKERERSQEKMEPNSSCLHCVSSNTKSWGQRSPSPAFYRNFLMQVLSSISAPQSHLSLCSEEQCFGPCCSPGLDLSPQPRRTNLLLRKVSAAVNTSSLVIMMRMTITTESQLPCLIKLRSEGIESGVTDLTAV